MISTEESEKLSELRSIIPTELLTKERFEDDYYLVRWLRARNLNVEKALDMLTKSMQWRTENNLDGILERGEDAPEKYRRIYPTGLLGTDYDGCVVLLLPLGRFHHRVMLEEAGMEAALKYNMIWMEKMMRLIKKTEQETGKKGLRLVEVVDMEHYSYKELTYGPAREFILGTNKHFEENYPEMLKSMLVINAPKVFTLLFNLIKPFLSKDTLSKISIYGGGSFNDEESWKQVIRSRFDPKLVPGRWGGVRQGSDDFCSDDPEVWIDAPIPIHFFTNKHPTPANLEDLTSERIPARNKFEIDLLLDSSNYSDGASIELHWKYKVESHNIGFSIIFHPNKLPTDDHKGNKEAIIILSECKTESKQGVQQGVHRCNSRNGLFTLIFDNRYSFTRSKTVYYSAELKQIP